MRSQAQRDQQTVTIATSLGIFVGTLALGALLGVLAQEVGDVPDGVITVLTVGTLALAVLLGLAYLVRHRRP